MAVSLLGFGGTGFNRPMADTGEGLLGFTMNPLLNSVHLAIGIAVVLAGLAAKRSVLSTPAIAGAVLLVIGLSGVQDGVTILGSNPATSVLDIGLRRSPGAGSRAEASEARLNEMRVPFGTLISCGGLSG